ncbi:hypothetical protein BDV95DRAFT_643904 [Massariosphaeria phaeospora]|uniref:Uncharacterized protein n=1 Tax=Massariosphaeria phaeospora TaxID=100035 RepID=A0A7C8MFD0_9PLEO|nr:hypothetical protein BDV95DRAFT_643904 [Massariosphaeria phaeospora]
MGIPETDPTEPKASNSPATRSVPDNEPATGESSKDALDPSLSFKELLLHLGSISTCLALIGVNAKAYYWADFGTQGPKIYGDHLGLLSQNVVFKYLQFLAKFHELLLLLSMSYIVVYRLQHHLLNDGLPFGFLDAPHQISAGGGDLLWSLAFWKATSSSSRSGCVLGMSLLFGTVISVSLGPSSAIALIPSLDWWDSGRLSSANATRVYYVDYPANHRGTKPWPTTDFPMDDDVDHSCQQSIRIE